jgi:hypothetical protein
MLDRQPMLEAATTYEWTVRKNQPRKMLFQRPGRFAEVFINASDVITEVMTEFDGIPATVEGVVAYLATPDPVE